MEKQDLFEARTSGYHTCRIPGIAVTKNNTVLVTTEARPGCSDYDFNDVLFSTLRAMMQSHSKS
jgi:hypothetical protein